MAGYLKDITGERFGQLVALNFDRRENGTTWWRCRCDCGGIKIARMGTLHTGDVKSCGCLNVDKAGPGRLGGLAGVRHGEAHNRNGDKVTKEYRAWQNLKQRCYNANHKAFPNYGGRGITVCKRWLNRYENFLADVGRAPSPEHSIDRINVNGNYRPANVRWATASVQMNNRRVA